MKWLTNNLVAIVPEFLLWEFFMENIEKKLFKERKAIEQSPLKINIMASHNESILYVDITKMKINKKTISFLIQQKHLICINLENVSLHIFTAIQTRV